MRSKTILSIAAFTVAFIFSAAFASLFITKSEPLSNLVVTPGYNTKKTSCFKNRGGSNYTADKIITIIKQDISNDYESGRKLYETNEDFHTLFESVSFPNYVEAVHEYVSSSESLSYENTPRDFQSAWRKHMKAWRDYADFLDKVNDSSARKNFSETEINKLENSYNVKIDSTWYEVLRIGRSHGAEVY